MAKYIESSGHWHSLDDHEWQGLALFRAATLSYLNAEWQQAIVYASRASDVLESSVDGQLLRARVLHLEGEARIETQEQSDIPKAKNVFNEALAIQSRFEDHLNGAITLNSLGHPGLPTG